MSDFVYGRRPVWEVLQAGKRSLHKVWLAERLGGGLIEDIVRVARERGVPVQVARRDALDQMAGGGHHQGIVAQVSAAAYLELEDFLKELPPTQPVLVIGLDEIQDPHNVGAILRSAGFFGVQAVLMPRWRSAPVGETAWRVSSGGAEHVAMIRVRNLVEAMEQLKEAGFQVLGAEMGAPPVATLKPLPRTALMVGSEGQGLRRLVRDHCDKLIGVPGRGAVESLNVASATAILLYELTRQE